MDVLVMATNRPSAAAGCLQQWQDHTAGWDAVVLVEDGPACSDLPPDIKVNRHLCWADIDRDLGEHGWIISRRDSAIKALGLLAAARMSATRIHTLDDDCFPHDGGVDEYREILTAGVHTNRWASSIPGVRVRGLPYGTTLGHVPSHLHMGLWSGIADVDAVSELAGLRPEAFRPDRTHRLVGHGFIPLCGMNLAFRSEMLPLLYFAPMGEGQPHGLGRFDDIWAGVVAKRGMDHLGLRMSVGGPVVRHDRLSDPYVNLRKEAAGIQANEHLWRLVDAAPLTARTPSGVAQQIGLHLQQAGRDFPVEDMRDYMVSYGRALSTWAWIADSILNPVGFAASEAVPS